MGAAGAGKTSILRRYFGGSFEKNRVPTIGADFYTGRIKNPIGTSEKKSTGTIHSDEGFLVLQIWDTAGRECTATGKYECTGAMDDDFLRHADAIMLVYDATSSTSFTQLLRWHSELMERLRNLEKFSAVLIVGNKIDVITERRRKNQRPERHSQLVPQRDVLGLNGNFKGKDSHYEYRVNLSKDVSKSQARDLKGSYLATYGEWTTDGSYLDSVLNSEARSHPDQDMVLLWCMRNGLMHIEASALDGTGLDNVMESLALLGLHNKEQIAESNITQSTNYETLSLQINEELDLQRRYASKENICFSLLRHLHIFFKSL